MLHDRLQFFRRLLCQKDFREEFIRDRASSYKGVIGYFSNFVPEEILYALELYPVRIIGDLTTDAFPVNIPSYLCSFVKKAVAAYGLQPSDIFDTVIIPSSCDSLRRLAELWGSGSDRLCYQLNHPLISNARSADYYESRLRDMINYLQKRFQVSLTEERLIASVRLLNEIRASLLQIDTMRKNRTISAADYFLVVTASFLMPKAEYLKQLKELIDKSADLPPDPLRITQGLPVMLIGPLCDNTDIIDYIESAGLHIADDDITNGTRYYTGISIPEGGRQLNKIAVSYLKRMQSPTFSDYSAPLKKLSGVAGSGSVKGIIYLIQKQCDPHYFNYPVVKRIAAENKLPVLFLEAEHSSGEFGFIKPRIEAFAERILSAEVNIKD